MLGALERIRRRLGASDDGDGQMVKILAAVLTDGMPEVGAACAQAVVLPFGGVEKSWSSGSEREIACGFEATVQHCGSNGRDAVSSLRREGVRFFV